LSVQAKFSNDSADRFVQSTKMVGAGQLALAIRMQSTEYATEGKLLAACRRREIRAFEKLYQIHSPRVKSIAYHSAGNRQDAEDAVQETFLKLYNAIGSFEGHSSIATWLCGIVINVCYDVGRKRRRETEPPAEFDSMAGAPRPCPTLRL